MWDIVFSIYNRQTTEYNTQYMYRMQDIQYTIQQIQDTKSNIAYRIEAIDDRIQEVRY